VAIQIRYLLPFIDPSAKTWSADARMVRWLTLLWLAIGLAVMFSASYTVADADQSDGLYYFKRQIVWAWIGLSIFNLVIHAPLRYILGMAHWGLIGCLGLILLTLVPGLGTNVNGATRWLVLGPVPLQPSELIKPFLVLQGARVFGKWQQLSMKTRATWLGIFGVVLLLILKQPNLSTASLCGMLLWLIALAAGLPYRYLGGTAFGGVLLATLSVTINEYQRRRIMSFTNPWADSQGDGVSAGPEFVGDRLRGSRGPWLWHVPAEDVLFADSGHGLYLCRLCRGVWLYRWDSVAADAGDLRDDGVTGGLEGPAQYSSTGSDRVGGVVDRPGDFECGGGNGGLANDGVAVSDV
jgi:Cell cycle protein